jgi:dienelactone hydrolase
VSFLWGNLKPGSFKVGFKSVQLKVEQGKSLQVSIWYPAKSSASIPSMRYVDYFRLSTNEQTLAVDKYKTRLKSFGIAEKAIDEWFQMKMAAIRDAPALNQTFPLLLIAQGNFHSAHDQEILSEYLATFGYIVATSASPTTTKPMETEEDVLPTAMQQASDMKLIVSRLKEDTSVDTNRIGIIGYSFGARCALLLASEMPQIKALISLDGGIANRQGKGLIEKSPLFRSEKFDTPLLHIYEDQEEFMQPDFDLLNSLKRSDRYLIRVQNMRHHEFASFGLAAACIPGLSSSPALKQKWDVIGTYTLKFVDAFLKKDRLAGKFIQRSPGENGFSSADFTFRNYPSGFSPGTLQP